MPRWQGPPCSQVVFNAARGHCSPFSSRDRFQYCEQWASCPGGIDTISMVWRLTQIFLNQDGVNFKSVHIILLTLSKLSQSYLKLCKWDWFFLRILLDETASYYDHRGAVLSCLHPGKIRGRSRWSCTMYWDKMNIAFKFENNLFRAFWSARHRISHEKLEGR